MTKTRKLRSNFGPVLVVMVGTDKEQTEAIACCYWCMVEFLTTSEEIEWWDILDPETGELFDSAGQHEQELADEQDNKEW